MYEVDSQDASIGWGPLTAGNFAADFQIIAATGAGLVTYSTAQASSPDISNEQAQISNPSDVDLFTRTIATDNDSTMSNYTAWGPQVRVHSMHAGTFSVLQSVLHAASVNRIRLITHSARPVVISNKSSLLSN